MMQAVFNAHLQGRVPFDVVLRHASGGLIMESAACSLIVSETWCSELTNLSSCRSVDRVSEAEAHEIELFGDGG